MRHDSDELSLKLARMFATATGAEVLAWMHETDFALTSEWVDRALARARTIWSTGGPVCEQQKAAASPFAAAASDNADQQGRGRPSEARKA